MVDVPNGQHGFDALDHTEKSRAAVRAPRSPPLTAPARRHAPAPSIMKLAAFPV
ncbi:hypothetical protein O7622_23880 [Micromonospora sp. WMMD1076]|uniref:hypothetical protein n=1 Tax=Micromonospora sp. WMMD1076 TaxID=3016103 RepID=UPI00249CB4B0|nr:hypothetical protein [Micromonospora sp. WMMD1076]WFF06077.1 hypothetical protein O7622_23880 [Micromonospora sp. WMMD1076]